MPKNTNINSQKQKSSIQTSSTVLLPSELSDDNADLLIRMQALACYDEQQTRREQIRATNFGQVLVFFLMLAFLILSFFLAYQGKSIVGTVFGSVGMFSAFAPICYKFFQEKRN